MKFYKRILIGILSVAMLSAFVGCSGTDDTKSIDDTSSSDSANDNSSEDDSSNSTIGDSSENNTTDDGTPAPISTEPDNLDYNTEITEGNILTISNYDIDAEEYRYYFLNIKYQYDYGDDSYWVGEEIAEVTDEDGNVTTEAQTAEENQREKLSTLKERVLTYLLNNYCVETMASDLGISLTDEELAEVENEYNEYKQSYESTDGIEFDTFEDYLASIYCTKDLYIKSLNRQALEEKVVCALYEEDFRANLLPQYYHCEHILFSTMSLDYDMEEVPEDATDEEKATIEASNSEKEEQAKAQVKAKAEEVLQQIKDGADFDELLAKYNEDTGESVDENGNIEGYYFKEGTMVTEFENAFFQLEEGEVSDVVETDYGYHIIKRLPIDEEYVKKNLVTLIMMDTSTYENTEYYDDYVSKADEYYEKLSSSIIFDDNYYNANTNSVIANSSVFAHAETTVTEETTSATE